jgi:hypothetical protein
MLRGNRNMAKYRLATGDTWLFLTMRNAHSPLETVCTIKSTPLQQKPPMLEAGLNPAPLQD